MGVIPVMNNSEVEKILGANNIKAEEVYSLFQEHIEKDGFTGGVENVGKRLGITEKDAIELYGTLSGQFDV